MLRLGDIPKQELQLTSTIVTALAEPSGITPESIMLIGAEARNLIHSALGHGFALRTTTDVDIALALSSWDDYDRIRALHPAHGATGIRFRLGGIPVDLVPFGGIEQPKGIATPMIRTDLNVFGFSDAFRNSMPLALPNGVSIRIPHPAGYAALKMRAWMDRAPDGNFKDATDIAVALFWYRESQHVTDRLYGTDLHILEQHDFDQDLASARVLGREISSHLAPNNRTALQTAWSTIDSMHLARELLLPRGNEGPGRRREYLDALDAGMLDEVDRGRGSH